jgi:hypothetical protein
MQLVETVFYTGRFKQKYSDVETDIVVLENPSRGEFLRFRARASGHDVRGLLDDGVLLVWESYIATHSDVAAFFHVDGSDLHLGETYVVMNDCPDDWTDEEAQQAGQWIKSHPAIVRLYGPNVSVTLEAPDNGRSWSF